MGLAADPQGRLLEVAIEHATSRVPTAHPTDSVGSVREKLIGQEFECAEDVAVLDDSRLVGVMAIEQLLSADAEARVADAMDSDPPVVAEDADQEVAARKMIAHGESSLGVIDAEGRFRGLVPPRRMLEVLLDEHDEDMARLGGYVVGGTQAKHAAEEVIGLRLRHRIPWLALGLLGAMAAALLVGAFEKQLESNVLVAFFVPAVIYMAGAVGTQTVTVLIRGMAVGIDLSEVVRREALTGLLLGVLIGASFFPFALLVWGDEGVAFAVSLALVASCSLSTLVAIVLPLSLRRLGTDPAFGSGPTATVLQDLISVAVYLALATLLAT